MMDACTWDSPGADPYRGTVAAAVARYELPAAIRAELVAKADALEPDGVLTITKSTAYSGERMYSLQDMHYGKGKVCAGQVHRPAWEPGHIEYALMYCAGTDKRRTCIAVPLVCHNVTLLVDLGVGEMPEREAMFAPDDGPRLPPGPYWLDGRPDGATVHHVPEPGTWVLALSALAVMAVIRRRKSK